MGKQPEREKIKRDMDKIKLEYEKQAEKIIDKKGRLRVTADNAAAHQKETFTTPLH